MLDIFSFSLFFFFFFPKKISHRPSDLGEGIRSLNHLVCIPKMCYSRSVNSALEFASKKSLKAQKKFHTSHLKERLECHLASTASTASITTKYHCPIRECLKSHLFSNHCQDLETQICAN